MTLAVGPLMMVLAAGIPAGTPRPVAEFQIERSDNRAVECTWMEFSPDGRTLVALLREPLGSARLVACDSSRWEARHTREVKVDGSQPAKLGVMDPKTGWVGFPVIGLPELRFVDPAGPGGRDPTTRVGFGAGRWFSVRTIKAGFAGTRLEWDSELEVVAWDPAFRSVLRSPPLGWINVADVCPGLTHAAATYTSLEKGKTGKDAVLFDLRTGGQTPLPGHDGEIAGSVLFRPDGRRLATTDGAGVIRLWEVPSGKLVRAVRGLLLSVYSLAYSPDGRHLACGSYDVKGRPNLWLLDATDGSIRASIAASRRALLRIAYHPDGRLATIDNDLRIRVWRPADLIR